MAGHAVDLAALGEQPPAEHEILVAEDDARAGAARGQRRGEARRPGADDQHVAEGKGLLVVVGIGDRRRRGRGRRRGGSAARRRFSQNAAGHMKVL